MKKIVTTMLLLAFCSVSQSQILSNASPLESATYAVNSTYQSYPHSQKILQYNSTQHIVLDRDMQNHSYFYLLQKNQSSATTKVSIPQEFKVNDFSIMGDTIYFCGQRINNGDTVGFIAYTSVYDMFNTTAQNYHYSLPVSVYDVYELVTYHNNAGERVIAAIGGQDYGVLHYTKFPGHTVDPGFGFMGNKSATKSGIIYGSDNNGSWVIDATIKRDCLIECKVKETIQNGVIYNESNIYYSTVTNKYTEMFEDMVLTDDYICIVCQYGSSIVLRRIDRNNFTNQAENIFNSVQATQYAYGRSPYPLANLGNNTIALAYGGVYNDKYCAVIYKINMNTTPLFTSIFGNGIDVTDDKSYVWDLEYLADSNQLLVLREKGLSGNPRKDYVYYLDMNNNLTYPYNTIAMTTSSQNSYLSNILRYSSNYFAIVGSKTNANNTLVQDKNIYDFYSSGGCSSYISTPVVALANAAFKPFPNDLLICRFATTTHIYSSPTKIQVYNFSAPHNSVGITNTCFNQSINYHFNLDNPTRTK